MRFIKLFQRNIKSVYKCVVKLTLALASVPLSPVLTSVCSHVPLLSSSFDLWHQCSQLLFPRDAAKLAVRQGSFPAPQIWAETLDWLLILQHPCASWTIFPQDHPVVRSSHHRFEPLAGQHWTGACISLVEEMKVKLRNWTIVGLWADEARGWPCGCQPSTMWMPSTSANHTLWVPDSSADLCRHWSWREIGHREESVYLSVSWNPSTEQL